MKAATFILAILIPHLAVDGANVVRMPQTRTSFELLRHAPPRSYPSLRSDTEVNSNHPKSSARESAARKGISGNNQPKNRQSDTTSIDTANCPRAELSSSQLHLRFYMPDARTGFYRSSRFDWSGVIAGLDYKGHTFFGRWNSRYDPTLNDAIMGPVESFSPVGYDEAQPGGTFLEPGVGILIRPDTNRYSPFRYYPVQPPISWNITRAPGAIAFRQDLSAGGYSYTYIKTIILDATQPRMTITHTLKNTGNKAIESDVYNHNFFVFDTLNVGPGRVLKLPWTPTATPADQKIFDSLAAVRGDSIIILQPFAPRKSFYTILTGYSDKPSDYDLRLEECRAGVGVRIRGDRPLAKLAYWSSLKTACPEPFIHIKANPGETITWTFTYDFYTLTL